MNLTMSLHRLLAVTALLLAACAGTLAMAAEDEPPLQNYHVPAAGEPFFLLTDATFGSDQPAQVRLEMNAPDSLATVGGVDLVIYRVPEPLAFLQKQRNLHRVVVDNKPAGEGLANTLTHLWDSWVVKARVAWQRLFSGNARRAVTEQAPALKTPTTLRRPSTFEEPPQFKPLPGLPVVQRFRYPLHLAKPIAAPKDLMLEGSSSAFIQPTQGNVFVPLGTLKPGLYLVEAMAGQYRATTLLFVSDTLALTKVSGAQMLVWSAHRSGGQAVPATQVVWTDGVGVLKSGTADAQGLVRLERPAAPEQTYVFGLDPAGGVFISENFYYDSEIYNAKVYATTDRPLYRPGDEVKVKVTGREFKNARESVALADGDMMLTVRDPAGQVVATQAMKFSAANGGADTRLQLPDNATAGGYELLLTLHDDSYTAAFRVADYQKPHFEIQWLPDKADYATGEAVSGKLQLSYPDGKPVANATLSLTARAQVLAMVEGELDDAGAFPLKLSQTELQTDGSGQAKFSLPAADKPSRYVLTVLATDGAAYRVRSTRELLVERGAGGWLLTPERQFSKPNQATTFRWSPSRRATATPPAAPVKWEWVRLEDRKTASGDVLAANAPTGAVSLSFPQPGSYTVTLRDAQRRIVAANSHFVMGDGLKVPTGSVAIVFDKPRYQAGDTAEALLTFPEAVDQALVTLERERVDAAALLTTGGDGFTTERVGAAQWKVRVKVREDMAPNVTFSVAYAKHGDSVFQNQGLLVEQPRVALAFKTDKAVYAPGEAVNVEVSTTVAGQPVAADVAVGVVDEMIYVLQPEIAPGIDDFFFHPRRNNVRTSVSLNFIGYDLATRKLGELPGRRGEPQRAVKVLERPRRDNVDTAAWEPRLHTDATGKARFTFRMPDSLTRWRLTGRAMAANGLVGQQTAWVRSDKAFYAKWTSPDWQRLGDQADASLALFNQGQQPGNVEWTAQGAGIQQQGKLSLKPGANFVTLPLKAEALGAQDLTITLRADGKVVDTLAQGLQRLPVGWANPRELVLDLSAGGAVPLQLPADARHLRVTLASDPAAGAFSRWTDDLIDYPYGCVEQTASRMLPLSIALQSLSAAQQPLAPQLTQRLSTARLALAQMAGPEARFGWWGRGMAPDAFLTAYAYYADWRATQALRTTLPAAHWERLLDVYAKDGTKLPPLQRALSLHWMAEMGLPVGSMVDALLEELASGSPDAAAARPGVSLAMVDDAPGAGDLALLLAAHTAGPRATPAARTAADAAAGRLATSPAPLAQSLLALTRRPGAPTPQAVLAQVRGEQPTFDRAQSLVWLHKALGGVPGGVPGGGNAGALPAPWVAVAGNVGQPQWTLPRGAARPATLATGDGAKWAYVAFDSSEAGTAPALPVQITRQLYRVVIDKIAGAKDATGNPALDSGRARVKLEPVKPGSTLDTNTLYLDALTLQSPQAQRRAVLDVALPPGAAVESGTWGLDVQDGKTGTPLERAQHQPTRQGYAVPVEALAPGQPLTLRHLVRFSQRGRFQLPPARLMRMYDPEAKALEGGKGWATVEVR